MGSSPGRRSEGLPKATAARDAVTLLSHLAVPHSLSLWHLDTKRETGNNLDGRRCAGLRIRGVSVIKGDSGSYTLPCNLDH